MGYRVSESEKTSSVGIGSGGYLLNVFAHEMVFRGVAVEIAFLVWYLVGSTKFRLCVRVLYLGGCWVVW